MKWERAVVMITCLVSIFAECSLGTSIIPIMETPFEVILLLIVLAAMMVTVFYLTMTSIDEREGYIGIAIAMALNALAFLLFVFLKSQNMTFGIQLVWLFIAGLNIGALSLQSEIIKATKIAKELREEEEQRQQAGEAEKLKQRKLEEIEKLHNELENNNNDVIFLSISKDNADTAELITFATDYLLNKGYDHIFEEVIYGEGKCTCSGWDETIIIFQKRGVYPIGWIKV